MDNILELELVSKTFPKSNYTLDKVSFSIPYGAIMGFVGENGAGKTTTIRMISTLLQATEGDAIVAGHSILTEPDMVRKSIIIDTYFFLIINIIYFSKITY